MKVVFADSCAGSECMGNRPLFSYSLWEISGDLVEDKEFLTIRFTDFESKRIAVRSLAPDLETGLWEVEGTAKPPTSGKGGQACDHSNENSRNHALCNDEYAGSIWIGYRYFNENGLLIEPGTAYREVIGEDGNFMIKIKKPGGIGKEEAVTLEIYMLNDRGKTIDTARQSFVFKHR